MPRPPLPLGAWGKITVSTLAPGRYVAKARIRDLDGVTRLVERSGTSKAGAERNLKTALVDRVAPSGETLTAESKVSTLATMYLDEVRAAERAPRTLDRYEYAAGYVTRGLGALRIREATTQRLDQFVRTVRDQHGESVARSARIVLSGMFGTAVRYGTIQHNPSRDIAPIPDQRKETKALTGPELALILRAVRESPVILNPDNKVTPTQTIGEYCQASDLTDVVTMFAATGARIGEVLGIRWRDVDLDKRTVSITGKVNRSKGSGMVREDFTKTKASVRTLPLPQFAVTMLLGRRVNGPHNPQGAVFPALTGNWRDPSAVSKQWRRVRDRLGFDWVTSHTFRRTVATLIDEHGLSARIGADQLGHAAISMTQDKYLGRKNTHTEVANVLDAAME